ncbi:hypothetical protein FRB94_006354 [Tulasnella sp. JGI-2019a]|nr:hypothetical protein FRB94_006354 [Tulasnella sp. JGI-2019a]
MPQQPVYADYKDREFQLPALVESQRQGWIFSAQAAAVVSVLFCGAETQLIATIKGDTPPEGAAGAYKFLLLLSYAAFLLNASATIASLLMIDRLGDMPKRALLCFPDGPPEKVRVEYLLEDYGVGDGWAWMRNHCLFSLVAGSWCMVLQIFLWSFQQDAKAVWITTAGLCAFGISPWLIFIKRK